MHFPFVGRTRHNALFAKSQSLLQEKMALIDENKKLADQITELEIKLKEKIKIELPVINLMQSGGFELGTLNKEDQIAHLREVYDIYQSKAFHREMAALVSDAQRFIMIEGDPDGLPVVRQVLVFIKSLIDRFGTIAAGYSATNLKKPETVHLRTGIGS